MPLEANEQDLHQHCCCLLELLTGGEVPEVVSNVAVVEVVVPKAIAGTLAILAKDDFVVAWTEQDAAEEQNSL
jgi:hypothetical protein